MNWLSFFLGTDWVHTVGFCIATVFVISLTAVCCARSLRNKPAAKHGVLLSAVAACLLVPVVGLVTGYLKSPILSIPVVAAQPDAFATGELPVHLNGVEFIEERASDSINHRPDAVIASTEGPVSANRDANPGSPAQPVLRADESPTRKTVGSSPAFPLVAGMWLFGTASLLVFAVRSHRRGWSIRRRAGIYDTARLQQSLELAQRHVNVVCSNVLVSDEVHAPIVHGVRQPAIILPRLMLDHISDDQLTDILIHELAHVRRRDTIVVAAETFARALFWPIATIHLLLRALGHAREEVCDNYVLAQRDGREYAETLFLVAQLASGRIASIPAVGILNWRGTFEQRIAGLLNARRSRSRKLSSPTSALLVLVSATASIALAGSRLVATEPKEEPPRVIDARPDANTQEHAELRGTVRDEDGKPVREDLNAVLMKALVETNTEPVWGQPVNGLQLGVAGIRGDQSFRPGMQIRFALLIRNASRETIRFEYEWPANCFWIEPAIETAGGQHIQLMTTYFRGGHKEFAETLEPDAVAVVRLQGTVGIGEQGRSTKWSPYIADPQPGNYRLSAGISPYLVGDDGKPSGKPFSLVGGIINFQIGENDEERDAAGVEGGKKPDRSVPETQEDAIAQIERAGGKVTVDERVATKPAIHVDFREARVTNDELQLLSSLADLSILILNDADVTDAGLEHIRGLTRLKGLWLYNTNISGSGLAYLKGMRELRVLHLNKTGITDEHLQHIAGLNNLEAVRLGNTKVTDAGMHHLKDLKRLVALNLSGTRLTDVGLPRLSHLSTLQAIFLNDTAITDAGVEHLLRFPALQTLQVKNTGITRDGVERLQSALPRCDIAH